MRWPRQQYLYAATDGKLFKIGVTNDLDGRAGALRVRFIKTWRRPYATEIERSVIGILAHACARGREWFALTEQEFLWHVHRAIRVEDDDRAIRLGIEPSRRPRPGEPSYEPPFELSWQKSVEKL